MTAEDKFGNVETGYTGTVHFGTLSNDTQAVLPPDYTFSAIDQGSHAFFPVLKTVGTQSLTVADTTNPAFAVTRSGISVVPGTRSVWAVTAPATTTAGTVQTITFTALDAFGNVATNYTGTVRFTSSDNQASLPGVYTFNPADAGSHTFSFALKTAGAQSISLTDVLNPSITATQGIGVTAATAASMSVSGFPAATTAGVAQNVTVTLRDAFGNVATGGTGTVAFSSSDPLAALPANYIFTAADAGVHTFSVALKKAGTQSISVTDLANSALTASQASILVSAAAVSQFGIAGPANVTQGVGFNITVSALDAFGNVVSGYRGKVHFSTTATNFGLPSDFTFSNNDNGVKVFSVTMNTLGFQSVTVTDTTNGTITGKIVVDVLAQTGGGGGGGGGTGGAGGGGGTGGP